MSDTTAKTIPLSELRTPEQEQAEFGAEVPAADELELHEINPVNAYLFQQDRWQGHFARLRAEDPVHFNEIQTAGRYWNITKYDDVRTVDGDWQTFSSAEGIALGLKKGSPEPEGPGRSVSFIAMDPPEQTAQRKTVRSVAAPGNLRNMEPLIRERTVQVLDSLPEGETFDWVDTVSIELTTMMLATLFDFPFEDRRKLTRWSDIVFAIPEPGGIIESHEQRVAELLECVTYFERLWEERRENPGNDLVSMLVHGEATKDSPTSEHLGNLILLIVGGNDTTRNTMSGSVYGLNKYPEQYDKLIADPTLIPKMVSEIIRWQTPLPYMRRTATRDTELGGKQIKKDDQVLMWYVSANRDESVFGDNADDIDIERENADRHLSFGYGVHFCMGSRLAELQLRILWEEILQRFERIEVQAEPERTLSSFVRGYTYLPVRVFRTTT
ncbi:cytochrome P450 [Acidimicrobium ferrooxidans]|uniref:Cytochrome P450 n=1 Tax=Acidimicrobium ferrooxidans TaxID=53635 RepID=A0ABS3ANY3_9ACTN|nr:cytochrome P450 [Acidimicrobium ferrooxidans]